MLMLMLMLLMLMLMMMLRASPQTHLCTAPQNPKTPERQKNPPDLLGRGKSSQEDDELQGGREEKGKQKTRNPEIIKMVTLGLG